MGNSTMKFVFNGHEMLNAKEINKEPYCEPVCVEEECKEYNVSSNNKLHPMLGIIYTVGLASTVFFWVQLLPIVATAISTTVLTMPIPIVTPALFLI